MSTAGGKGRIGGPLLAIFIIGFLNYGLGLVNIQAQSLLIIVGLLLILSVLVLNVRFRGRASTFGAVGGETGRSSAADQAYSIGGGVM